MVSSKDVAKLAGVSQSTVSRVLNHPTLVQEETRKKVEQAIKELKYIPNAHARSLVQNKTGLITLLSGPLYNPFFVETTSAIVNYANSKGYQVNVQFVTDDELTETYESAMQNKMDGMILSCILLEDKIFEHLKELSIPFLTYNRKHEKNEYFVEIDNEAAGYLAAKHLLALGHPRIAWIGGSLKVSTFRDRFLGVKKAFEEANHSLNPAYIIHDKATKEEVFEAYHLLENLKEPPTAYIGGADSIALDLLDIAYREGKKVPEQLSVIGIDNVEEASHGAIRLTTVGSKSQKNIGAIAIEELIHMIENKKNTCIQITESVKVFRRSTTRQF